MVDFPNGVPEFPTVNPLDPPGSMASGLGLRSYLNRVGDNLDALINEFYQRSVHQMDSIVNGGPQVWSDGISFASAANLLSFAEMWRYGKSAVDAVHTVSQSTDVPAVGANRSKIPYSIQLDVTTADASVAAGDVVYLYYLMEGFNWNLLAQREFTIRFWVKAAKTGIHCVALKNSGSDRSYIAEYSINAANTWEEKSITVPASPTAGTWNYTNGTGIRILFTQMCGTTFQNTAGVWHTGNFHGTANQVNECDNVANNFFVCGLAAHPGPYCPPYVQRPFILEKFMCERYYQKSYSYGVSPGTDTITGLRGFGMGGSGSANLYARIEFYPSLRITPTLSLYGKAGAANKFYIVSPPGDWDLIGSISTGEDGAIIVNNTTGTEQMFFHFKVDARLT